MKPIIQTKLSTPDNPEKGNCLAACIASILEITIDEVPDLNDEKWFQNMNDFLEERGFTLDGSETFLRGELAERSKYYAGVDGYVIMCGESPRGNWVTGGHCVIYKGGKMVHDPHPSGDGLNTLEYFLLIREIDPTVCRDCGQPYHMHFDENDDHSEYKCPTKIGTPIPDNIRQRMNADRKAAEEKLIVNVWDWVVLKSGKVIQINHDDMMGVSYENIERHATKEEIKKAKRNKLDRDLLRS